MKRICLSMMILFAACTTEPTEARTPEADDALRGAGLDPGAFTDVEVTAGPAVPLPTPTVIGLKTTCNWGDTGHGGCCSYNDTGYAFCTVF